MWHDESVIVLFQIVLRLLIDLIALLALAFRQRRATAAEILVLRRQLALYKERGIKPRRIDLVTRISLALLSRFFNWRDALVVVSEQASLAQLHVVLQVAFGWSDGHLYTLQIHGWQFGDPSRAIELALAAGAGFQDRGPRWSQLRSLRRTVSTSRWRAGGICF